MRGGAGAEAAARALEDDGFAVLDDFLSSGSSGQVPWPEEGLQAELLAVLRVAAEAIDARDPEACGFLGSVAAGLLEGRLPDGHPMQGQLCERFYGPSGAAPADQEPSCLQQVRGPVRRSWLRGRSDALAPELVPLTEALDALLGILRDVGGDQVRRRLQRARFRDNVMVARHDGAPFQGTLELPFDQDQVLRARHQDWKGDGVLTAVLFLGPGSCVRIRNTSGTHDVWPKPGRLLMHWPLGTGSSHELLAAPAGKPLLALVVRFFDGKRSLHCPPGLEHIYRHCNPVAPLSRLEALEACAHDAHHARRIAAIGEFFEEHGGDRLDPASLDAWLGGQGFCSQCGRFFRNCSVVRPLQEFSGRWACTWCVRLRDQAGRLEVREADGAVCSCLAIYEPERRFTRQCMQDPERWTLEIRHSTALTVACLAAPEVLVGDAPCALSALGECGDTTCVCHRGTTPGARPAFLEMACRYVAEELHGKRLMLTFLGSGHLYFELLVLEQLLRLGVEVSEVHLVDTAYEEPGKLAERAAIAQFAAWFSQVKTFMHISIRQWLDRLSARAGGADSPLHAVFAVDCGGVVGEWEAWLKPTLQGSLPQGSLFLHLTQSRDTEAVKEKHGEEAPRFAWSEVHRLRLVGGQLAFQRLERRDWSVGDTGTGTRCA